MDDMIQNEKGVMDESGLNTSPKGSPKSKGNSHRRRKSWCAEKDPCKFCKDYHNRGSLRQACLFRPKELKKPRKRGDLTPKRMKSYDNVAVLLGNKQSNSSKEQPSKNISSQFVSNNSSPSQNEEFIPPPIKRSHSMADIPRRNPMHSEVNKVEQANFPPSSFLQRSLSISSLDFEGLDLSEHISTPHHYNSVIETESNFIVQSSVEEIESETFTNNFDPLQFLNTSELPESNHFMEESSVPSPPTNLDSFPPHSFSDLDCEMQIDPDIFESLNLFSNQDISLLSTV